MTKTNETPAPNPAFGLDCSAQGECLPTDNQSPDAILEEFTKNSEKNKELLQELEKIDNLS